MVIRILSRLYGSLSLLLILLFAVFIQSCNTTKYIVDYKDGSVVGEKFAGNFIRIKNLASGNYITIINEKVVLTKLNTADLKSQIFTLGKVDDSNDPKLFVLQYHDDRVLHSGNNFSLSPFTADIGKVCQFGIMKIGNEEYTLINTPVLKQDQKSKEKLKVQWTEYKGELMLANLIEFSNPSSSNQFWKIELVPENWMRQDDQIFYELTYDIQCIEENDGAGNDEEIFGNIYVRTDSGSKIIWNKVEDNAVEIDEGNIYSEQDSYLFMLEDQESYVTIGGHLYEEDTGGDDDLGKEFRTFKIKNFLDKPSNMVFTHDDTKIHVNYSVRKANGKYLTIDSLKCVKPSLGTDEYTELFLDAMATAGAAAAHGLSQSGYIDASVGTTIVETLIALRDRELAKEYGRKHPGSDDFYIKINEKHIWPEDEYIAFNSQDIYFIGKTWKLINNLHFKFMEYDRASKNDTLGEWTIKDYHDGTKQQILVLKNDEEESIYELIFTVNEYREGYLLTK